VPDNNLAEIAGTPQTSRTVPGGTQKGLLPNPRKSVSLEGPQKEKTASIPLSGLAIQCQLSGVTGGGVGGGDVYECFIGVCYCGVMARGVSGRGSTAILFPNRLRLKKGRLVGELLFPTLRFLKIGGCSQEVHCAS